MAIYRRLAYTPPMSAIPQEPLPPFFRPMWLDDLPQILEIERAAYPFPWTEGVLTDCIKVGYSSLVMELDEVIAGYGILSIAAGEANILNVCVSPSLQGQGLGRRLMENLLSVARRRKAGIAFLEVRASNSIAQRLYQSLGFNQIGSRRNYYPAHRGREDAVMMALELL